MGNALTALAATIAFLAGAAAQAPTTNPVAPSSESVARGKNTYLRHCQDCHGPEGHGDSAIAVAADLTRPNTWKQGAADQKLFASIADGAGDNMPSLKADLRDNEIWDVINFIRSIGPKPQ